jgi:predicted nucleotidyltransferase
MDFQRPLLSVTPTLDGDVLAALARAQLELSGGELASHIGRGSTEGVRRAADRLVSQGTVTRRPAGNAQLYSLNRDHLAAPYIEGLASLRMQLIERLRETIAAWDQAPRVALLFGSVARGEAESESDLDLLVVRQRAQDPEDERWRDQLDRLQRSATAWTGNDAQVVEYREEELVDARRERLFDEVLRDGIELFGTRRTLRRLIGPQGGR